MVSYISNDGLIGYAKELKDTDLFNIIKTNAEKYNTAEKAVVDEINMQFEYMAKINMQYLSWPNQTNTIIIMLFYTLISISLEY